MEEIKPVKTLNWVDLIAAVLGIGVLFVLLVLATKWAAARWPHEQLLLYLNGFLTQLAFLFLIWVIKTFRKWNWADFGWRPVKFRQVWPSIIGLYIFAWSINFMYGLFLLSRGFTPPETDVYSQLFGQATLLTFLLNFLLASILAPLTEETLFRGVIFGSLHTYLGKWTAAVISSALFSLLHFQAYGFLPRFMLGLILAHMYEKNRSLYPSMALHALNNFVATALLAGLSM